VSKKITDQLHSTRSKLLRIFLKTLRYFVSSKVHFRISEIIIKLFISKFIFTKRFDGKWICITNVEVGKFIDGADHKRFNKNNFSPLLKKYIRKNSIVIDIGTSYGDEVIDFSQLVGPRGRVYAFEGNKDYFEALKKTINLNSIKNVECICAFVGSKNSFLNNIEKRNFIKEPYVKGRDMEYSEKGQQKCINLDSYIPEIGNKDVSFIKIDTDGFELEILKGAKKLLSKNKKCTVISEFIPDTYYGKMKNLSVLKEYKRLGFKISKIQMSAVPLKEDYEKKFIKEINQSNLMISHDIVLETK
tara:strand:+ start:5439 stop:6344 length:906 start_codon:yes stop_codon:yes gene_type:complete